MTKGAAAVVLIGLHRACHHQIKNLRRAKKNHLQYTASKTIPLAELHNLSDSHCRMMTYPHVFLYVKWQSPYDNNITKRYKTLDLMVAQTTT